MEGGRSGFPRAAGEASAAAANLDLQASPGENSSGKIAGGQEQGREEIEGLNWGDDQLANEIDVCLGQLKDVPLFDHRIVLDDESPYLDEEQLELLNQRLALCRIRAHDERYQDMDDESLSKLFRYTDLAAKGYYKRYEVNLQWFFDPVYCKYAHLEDYQRLMLPNNGAYEDWEYYRRICSSLEGDQQFIQFWEELSTKTELIQLYMARTTTREPRIGKLFYYHALKIAAAGYPDVCRILIQLGFMEFRYSVEIEFTWYQRYADFLHWMWRMIDGDKLSFERALRHVYDDGKYSFVFPCDKFEKNIRTLEELYKPLLDRIIDEKTEDDRVKGLIMEFCKENEGRRKTYYDYAKRKLSIARQIGLIRTPPTGAPSEKSSSDQISL